MLRRRILFIALLLTTGGRAELKPIGDAMQDPAWAPLLASLSQNQTRRSHFEEDRYFPFRKKAIVLTGEMRLVPHRGLSLHYLTPEIHTVIVDDKGLLTRDEQGRDQGSSDEPRAQAALAAMINVLHFNLAELQKTFAIRGERTEQGWTLEFAPASAAAVATLGTLTVSGVGQTLQTIVISRSRNQRIEIIIRDSSEGVTFSEQELKRYFR